MKYLISILVVCLGAGCATRKDSTSKSAASVPGTSIPAKRLSAVRTPEVVKAYPAGRYTDPNYPDEMHERHTVYRREQAPDWNYLPDPPPMLSAGGSVSGTSDARQQVYAEALQEQNRAMRKRIDELQQQAGKVQGLEQEIDRLKDQIDANPKPPVVPTDLKPTQAAEDELFSSVEPELPAWEEGEEEFPNLDGQDALFSQMRANDQVSAELAAAERRKISAALSGPFLRRKEFVLLNH